MIRTAKYWVSVFYRYVRWRADNFTKTGNNSPENEAALVKLKEESERCVDCVYDLQQQNKEGVNT